MRIPNKPIITVIVEHVKNKMNYGDFISHSDLTSIMSNQARTVIVYPSEFYFRLMSKVHHQLSLDGAVLKSIRGQGYYKLKPDEYPAHVAHLTSRAYRLVKMSESIANNAPVKLMSTSARNKMRRTRSMTKVMKRDVLKQTNMIRKANGQIAFR